MFWFKNWEAKVFHRIIFRRAVHRSKGKKKRKQNTHYHESWHECCVETNGEPVAADIFYHPLPFHELTSIATNRVLTSGIVLVSPSPLMDNYPSIMCANLRNVLYPVS